MSDPQPSRLPRIGHGYDLHRLEQGGRPLIVGGEVLAHDHGLVSHSDGDVLFHAVTDALLGAVAAPDIGRLFPDRDPTNEGRDSADFVAAAMEQVRDAGYRVGNLDTTIVLQRPKLGDARDRIRATLAALLGVSVQDVNVKAKTKEQVDAVGEGRAIEAHAAVILFPAQEDAAS